MKADRLSQVRWKDTLDVHIILAAYIAASKKIILTINFKRCLIQSRHFFEASAVGIPSLHRFRFVYSVIIAFCRCFRTRLWSLCWRRCLRCAKRCSLLRGCLLRSARRWILIGVLQRSFNGKSSSARICSHLLCLQLSVISMGNCSWFTDCKHQG